MRPSISMHAEEIAYSLYGLSLSAHLFAVFLFLWTRCSHERLAALEKQRGSNSRETSVPGTPRFSILKPLSGCDDELDENLESFARLEDCSYELLFGVASVADPALRVAQRFIDRHPWLDARILVTNPHAALNPKVAQLITLERAARGSVLVVSDANVRVRPCYLRKLSASLRKSCVGLVSNAIVGTGERTTGAALENLILATHVTVGVLSIYRLTGRALTVGKSMAIPRTVLAAVGGFAAVGEVLAEDHALGRLIHRAGFRICISPDLVENRNVACTWRRSFERHTRWAKIRRAMAPPGFLLEPLALPIVTSTAAVLVTGSPLSYALLVLAIVLQSFTADACLLALGRARFGFRTVPLEIARSFLLVLCWVVACVDRSVRWRGHPLTIGRGTRLLTIRPVTAAREARSPLAHALRRAAMRETDHSFPAS